MCQSRYQDLILPDLFEYKKVVKARRRSCSLVNADTKNLFTNIVSITTVLT